MRQEFCLNHSSGLNAQNILSRILDQARLTGGLPKPVFLTFLSVAPVYHARVEARPKIMGILDGANIFQSTRPRGARQDDLVFRADIAAFQSTRPVWGATHHGGTGIALRTNFNPHAPHGGATSIHAHKKQPRSHFNPRAPHGARLHNFDFHCMRHTFQSTRPHGARQAMTLSKRIAKKFQSTRPRGARQKHDF